MARYELACCAIYRDEAHHLAEWLRFHARAGVEHFFLYDNQSADEHRDVIAAALPMGCWTLVDWPARGAQREAYQHCLDTFGADCRWLAFIDVDEFLFSPRGRDLRSEIAEFGSAPAVAVNGLLFGTSGHEVRPPSLVTASYCWRARETTVYPFRERLRDPDADPGNLASYYPMSAHVKCIVDPARTLRCESPHRFLHAEGAVAITENGEPVPRNYSERVSLERFRIHHYWTRSREEFRAKLARDRVSGQPKYDGALAFEVEALMHEVHDVTLRTTDGLPPDERLARAAGLSTVRLLPEYTGEERGVCARYPESTVLYCAPGERRRWEVTVHGGRLLFRDGTEVHTLADERGRHGLFVLSPEGDLFVCPRSQRGRMHHSSLMAGGSVASAGRMRVEYGVLRAIDSESGHYRPPPTVAVQVLEWLRARGVRLDCVSVRWL